MGADQGKKLISVSCFPLSEPDLTSSLRMSPDERCVKPYLATIRSHCVPFPQPGPPRTQMMGSLASFSGVLSMFFLSNAIIDFLFSFLSTFHSAFPLALPM